MAWPVMLVQQPAIYLRLLRLLLLPAASASAARRRRCCCCCCCWLHWPCGRVLFLFSVFCDQIPEEDGVLVLDPSNFADAVAQVSFAAGWCGVVCNGMV